MGKKAPCNCAESSAARTEPASCGCGPATKPASEPCACTPGSQGRPAPASETAPESCACGDTRTPGTASTPVQQPCACGGISAAPFKPISGRPTLIPATPAEAACCGPGPIPPLGSYPPPGTDHPHMVVGWLDTPLDMQGGGVPLVRTELTRRDRLGAVLARLGATRNNYSVSPGLYGVGAPGPDSPVLVSANYKLSFDALRKELSGLDLWLLVLDTRGVNVWCAAGKRTFSTDEVLRMVRGTGLERLVSHRRLILPQLAATGVSARAVRQGCGFAVSWGPVRASDLLAYLAQGRKADTPMRRVTFTLAERAVLVPVEFWVLRKAACKTLLALAVIGLLAWLLLPLALAMSWAGTLALGLAVGAAAGGLLGPLLLPWLPGRSFWIKGLATGLVPGAGLALLVPGIAAWGAALAGAALSSWMVMNFTGATPFTSPSGVEKEMRRGIPVQLALTLTGLGLWLAGPLV